MTQAPKIFMRPEETIKADRLLNEHLFRVILLPNEEEWSGWWLYEKGWSDKLVAEKLHPRLNQGHISTLRRATGRGRLWSPMAYTRFLNDQAKARQTVMPLDTPASAEPAGVDELRAELAAIAARIEAMTNGGGSEE